jgi:hypothetical protein
MLHVIFDDHGGVSPLEEMPYIVVLFIEKFGVRHVDVLDGDPDWHIRCFNMKVHMVCHQTITKDMQSKSLACDGQQPKVFFIVFLCVKKVCSAISAVHDVVGGTFVPNAVFPRHTDSSLAALSSSLSFMRVLSLYP